MPNVRNSIDVKSNTEDLNLSRISVLLWRVISLSRPTCLSVSLCGDYIGVRWGSTFNFKVHIYVIHSQPGMLGLRLESVGLVDIHTHALSWSLS